MKTIYNILLFACLILAFSSCHSTEDEPISGAFYSENFVQAYIIPDRMEISVRDYGHLQSFIYVKFYGTEIDNMSDAHEEQFSLYSQKYGDTHYNQKLVPFTNWAMGEDIQTIDIRCDKDIDSEHPTGTSLNDVIKLFAASPYRFIQNDYKKLDDYQIPEDIEGLSFREGYYPVYKLLSDVTVSDLTLLAYDYYLDILPSLSTGEYNFTITVKFENGRILTGTVKYVAE
ncbi:hypothetical protein [Dysgonomonas sp. 25]|uniref:hypothetical protein n=1 Tax=Dysgonomonas sp. 25 TaxID=2302933 RepID=UPI0013D6B934|nr:hypothetical protein [Dysgonomonas sp. 25]NDV70365.1 hypothetical protein [Dysgonomonas sp. 25]